MITMKYGEIQSLHSNTQGLHANPMCAGSDPKFHHVSLPNPPSLSISLHLSPSLSISLHCHLGRVHPILHHLHHFSVKFISKSAFLCFTHQTKGFRTNPGNACIKTDHFVFVNIVW